MAVTYRSTVNVVYTVVLEYIGSSLYCTEPLFKSNGSRIGLGQGHLVVSCTKVRHPVAYDVPSAV